MRWLDDVSMDLRKMGINEWKDRAKVSRGLEAYCKGGRGPPRAVAPSKKNFHFLLPSPRYLNSHI